MHIKTRTLHMLRGVRLRSERLSWQEPHTKPALSGRQTERNNALMQYSRW